MENVSFNAQPDSLAYYCTIGVLRNALKYRSREAMARNWVSVFPDEILPEDHQTVAPDRVESFLTEISKPKRGRPGTITGAAQFIIKKLNQMNEAAKNFNIDSEKIDDEILMSSESLEKDQKPAATFTETSDNLSEQTLLFNKVLHHIWEWAATLTKLDVVFSVTIAIADYGLTFLLREMGVAAAIIYTLISLHALSMAKDRYSQVTAERGIVAVWVLEFGAFFIHMTMFNRRIWTSIDKMPFKIDDIATESRPFYIALIMALLFSGAGIYAVSTTLSLVTERSEAEQFEIDHERKY